MYNLGVGNLNASVAMRVGVYGYALQGPCPDSILVGTTGQKILMHQHPVAVTPDVNDVVMVKRNDRSTPQ